MLLLCSALIYAVGIWAVVEVALGCFGRTTNGRIVVLSLAIVSGAVLPWVTVRFVLDKLRECC